MMHFNEDGGMWEYSSYHTSMSPHGIVLLPTYCNFISLDTSKTQVSKSLTIFSLLGQHCLYSCLLGKKIHLLVFLLIFFPELSATFHGPLPIRQ